MDFELMENSIGLDFLYTPATYFVQRVKNAKVGHAHHP
jgi:hypothetical protein